MPTVYAMIVQASTSIIDNTEYQVYMLAKISTWSEQFSECCLRHGKDPILYLDEIIGVENNDHLK